MSEIDALRELLAADIEWDDATRAFNAARAPGSQRSRDIDERFFVACERRREALNALRVPPWNEGER